MPYRGRGCRIFQFTPLREGRRPCPCQRQRKPSTISIHAPPRGATGGDASCKVARVVISIHAPPRGATGDCFGCCPLLFISIHAPPRGATNRCSRFLRGVNFNSRPSARGDPYRACGRRRNAFQFTPLREGRPGCGSCFSKLTDIFQFTPLREGRRQNRRRLRLPARFQFTPLREGRPISAARPAISIISIHAPPRGATRWGLFTPRMTDFNSRPSARGDQGRTQARLIHQSFQFTPLREGRRYGGSGGGYGVISIHAPPRGATAKDMQFLQIFCSTLTNQHGLTIMPRNLSRLFW